MADESAHTELRPVPPETEPDPILQDRLGAPDPAPVDRTPIIVFENVSISFGDNAVLKDVSFFVERGQTLCILGRSGVGKSVSLRILMGFLKPDSGSVRVEGREITTLSEDGMQEIRKRITMVFQNGALFDSLSVRENVAFPLRERGSLDEDQIQQLVDRLILMVGAEDVEESLPAGLSTGRRRAVAIARALASQPEVVLYDEPTTMVDPIMSDHMASLMLRLKKQLKLTSVVVTHDLDLMRRVADRVVMLDEGKVTYFGPTEGLYTADDPHIQEFLALDQV